MLDILFFIAFFLFFVSVLCIFFTATWGDLHYLGLTGLEVLGETFESIPITLDMLEVEVVYKYSDFSILEIILVVRELNFIEESLESYSKCSEIPPTYLI